MDPMSPPTDIESDNFDGFSAPSARVYGSEGVYGLVGQRGSEL
jgi:hypothetical protein